MVRGRGNGRAGLMGMVRYLLDYFRGEFIYGFPFLSGDPQALHIQLGFIDADGMACDF